MIQNQTTSPRSPSPRPAGLLRDVNFRDTLSPSQGSRNPRVLSPSLTTASVTPSVFTRTVLDVIKSKLEYEWTSILRRLNSVDITSSHYVTK